MKSILQVIHSIFIWIKALIQGEVLQRIWIRKREESYQHTQVLNTSSDLWFIALILTLMTIGVVMVYSASVVRAGMTPGQSHDQFLMSQFKFAIFGCVVLFISSRIPYQFWGNMARIFLIFGFFCLLLVFVPGLGKTVNGSARWVRFLGFNFQPTELFKISWLIFLAHYYSDPQVKLNRLGQGFGIPLACLVPAFVIFVAQPDLGSAMMCIFYFAAIFILVGGTWKLIAVIAATGISMIGLMMAFYSHPRKRIMSFWNQLMGTGEVDYNLKQALISFGSGRVHGTGLGEGTQKRYYLPEAHTDFIFDIYGEEFGFIGVLILVGLYFALFLRGLKIARNCPTVFGSVLGAGISIAIFMQALINMGMSIGLLPTKGLTLPLVSYGGSSLILVCFSLGILINLSKATPLKVRGTGATLFRLSRKYCTGARDLAFHTTHQLPNSQS